MATYLIPQHIGHVPHGTIRAALKKSWPGLTQLMIENHAAANINGPMCINREQLEACNPLLWILWDHGQAVGYCAHIVAPHVFTGELTANCAAIYVRPAYRANVQFMLDKIEQELKEQGVTLINYSVPHMSRAGSFFEAIGYECRELVMYKRLEQK